MTKTLEELRENETKLKEWWTGLSHTQKRIFIGYKDITTTTFDELPERIQLAMFGHWDYWYKS